ncbi:hypothetical protein GCM10009785_06340 [Brooklawnia cerclae]|uniref:Alpha/beta hydrolase n=1 Tax=Brooklawnia cerclae TaxID=349934 RepID=A0ABX0SDH2_9ACTN|nr:hypothetical protein [Brooklawnia cerclae]NIH56443.1 hypothetical protein [Brooklawnia cerclae]
MADALMLIDPQFGVHGLGLLESALPDARTWPAATISSMRALPQAYDALAGIRAEGVPPRVVVARAAGCNTGSRLLADGIVTRVLLIDPVATSTADGGFSEADRTDSQLLARLEQLANGAPIEPDPEALAIWTDPLIKRGFLPETAYGVLVRGMSRRPEAHAKLEAALRAVEKPRQPYDEQRWPPMQPEPGFDWLADLRDAPPGAATIWLSHDNVGRPPTARQAYLTASLPNVETVIQPWDELDFFVDPAPLAAAIREWLGSR